MWHKDCNVNAEGDIVVFDFLAVVAFLAWRIVVCSTTGSFLDSDGGGVCWAAICLVVGGLWSVRLVGNSIFGGRGVHIRGQIGLVAGVAVGVVGIRDRLGLSLGDGVGLSDCLVFDIFSCGRNMGSCCRLLVCRGGCRLVEIDRAAGGRPVHRSRC